MSDTQADTQAPRVPPEVAAVLRSIRESGKTNMVDFHGVQRAAYELDAFETVLFLQDIRDGMMGSYLDVLNAAISGHEHEQPPAD